MEPTFEKLLARLADHSVEFLLVGGVAVTLHGYARLTEDVDILIQNSPENVARLLGSLADYGEGFVSELNPEDFTDEEGAIRIVEEVERSQLDIFTRMSGFLFEDLVKDAEAFHFSDREVLYASKKTLIDLKSRSVREKDQMDVAALKKLEADPSAFD